MSREFEILRETNTPTGARADEEDPDLALAKLLQAQERELFLLGGAGSYGNWGANENVYPDGSHPMGDEELARMLLEQEQREHMQRMLAMAGFPADESEPVPEGDGDVAGDGGEAEGSVPDQGAVLDRQVDGMSYEQLLSLGELGGHVSKGAKADALQALPERAYGSQEHPAGAEGEQCAVCCMEFEQGEAVKVLPCRHFYHAPCADKWLAVNRACPVCFKDIDAAPADAEKASAPA